MSRVTRAAGPPDDVREARTGFERAAGLTSNEAERACLLARAGSS